MIKEKLSPEACSFLDECAQIHTDDYLKEESSPSPMFSAFNVDSETNEVDIKANWDSISDYKNYLDSKDKEYLIKAIIGWRFGFAQLWHITED